MGGRAEKALVVERRGRGLNTELAMLYTIRAQQDTCEALSNTRKWVLPNSTAH